MINIKIIIAIISSSNITIDRYVARYHQSPDGVTCCWYSSSAGVYTFIIISPLSYFRKFYNIMIIIQQMPAVGTDPVVCTHFNDNFPRFSSILTLSWKFHHCIFIWQKYFTEQYDKLIYFAFCVLCLVFCISYFVFPCEVSGFNSHCVRQIPFMILPWQWKSITMVVKCVIALNWTLKPELIYYLTFMSIKFSTKGPTFYQIIKNWCLFKNIVIIIILASYGWCCSAFLQSINMAACPRGFRVVGQNCTANYPSPPPHHNRHDHHLQQISPIRSWFCSWKISNFLPKSSTQKVNAIIQDISLYMVVQRTR